MKGVSGIQMNTHIKFHREFKQMKEDRVKKGKEHMGDLSDKRFSLTLAKAFRENWNGIRDVIVNCEINLSED